MTVRSTEQDIIDYYFDSKLDYQLYNLRVDDLAMHYGIWDETTRTHREALLNENLVVARIAGIGAADHVVDFGCGYGSSAVWLASHIGCHVSGITLSQDQVDEATRLARERHVGHLVQFCRMDFHQTKFAPETFDIVMAIESIAHSTNKPRVLHEAYRLLKPGGRIVVADGYFLKRKAELTTKEWKIARACFAGVHVPPLAERDEFEQWLGDAGFRSIQWTEKTQAILPTARRVHWLGIILMPVAQMCRLLGFSALRPSHMRAFIYQYHAFRDGIGTYGVFCGTKARRDSAESSQHGVISFLGRQ